HNHWWLQVPAVTVAQPVHDGETIKSWHDQIQQEQIRLLFAEHIQRLLAIVSPQRLVSFLRHQQIKQFDLFLAVINDQEAARMMSQSTWRRGPVASDAMLPRRLRKRFIG